MVSSLNIQDENLIRDKENMVSMMRLVEEILYNYRNGSEKFQHFVAQLVSYIAQKIGASIENMRYSSVKI